VSSEGFNASGGYTCGTCGMFVLWGHFHQCHPQAPRPDPTWALVNVLQQIERELKRVADVLESEQSFRERLAEAKGSRDG
jgi:hypothetical protein